MKLDVKAKKIVKNAKTESSESSESSEIELSFKTGFDLLEWIDGIFS